MNPPVKAAFAFDGLTLPLTSILPIRTVKHSDHAFGKFRAIVASIKEVGVIEPLVVYPQRGGKGTYVLLDGHLRLRALQELEKTEVFCILATTDDAFSYNHQINRISIIQEHKMILRAIERGVTPEQIAKALAVDVAKIIAGMNLLDGIHPDAVELLKDKPISAFALQLLRKAKPTRQIDMAHLMVSGNNFIATPTLPTCGMKLTRFIGRPGCQCESQRSKPSRARRSRPRATPRCRRAPNSPRN